MKRILTIAAAAVLLLNSTSTEVRAADAASKTVVGIAASNDDFSTLVTAVKAADLADALSGPGPFTVFAPTNAAFDKVPKDALGDLLKPENKAKLASVLKYHVVSGKVMAADVKPGKVKTLEGSEIEISSKNGAVYYGNAKVLKTDIVGSNGVIHVIDTVVMP